MHACSIISSVINTIAVLPIDACLMSCEMSSATKSTVTSLCLAPPLATTVPEPIRAEIARSGEHRPISNCDNKINCDLTTSSPAPSNDCVVFNIMHSYIVKWSKVYVLQLTACEPFWLDDNSIFHYVGDKGFVSIPACILAGPSNSLGGNDVTSSDATIKVTAATTTDVQDVKIFIQ